MATQPSFDESNTEGSDSESSEYSSQPIPITVEKPEDRKSESKSDSESDSKSESESDSEAAAEKFRVKPVSPLKPKVEKKHASKSTPKPIDNGSAATLKMTPAVAKAKRPAEKESFEVEMLLKKHKNENGGAGRVIKKSAKKTDLGGTDKKVQQPPYKRVWSDEDEIVILEGLVDYAKKKGGDPTTDKNGFYDFIKEILRTRYTRKQMSDKVRRLKAKYEEVERRNKDLTVPHEKKSFELYKKIWGSEKAAVMNAGNNLPVENDQKGKIDKEAPTNGPNGETDEEDAADGLKGKTDDDGASGKRGKDKEFLDSLMVKSLVELGMDESVVRLGISLAREDKKEVMESKWREFALEEMELIAKKFKLIQRSCQFVCTSLKSEGK